MDFQQIHISRKLSHFLTILCVTAIFSNFFFSAALAVWSVFFIVDRKIQDFRYEKIKAFHLFMSVSLIGYDCLRLSIGGNLLFPKQFMKLYFLGFFKVNKISTFWSTLPEFESQLHQLLAMSSWAMTQPLSVLISSSLKWGNNIIT